MIDLPETNSGTVSDSASQLCDTEDDDRLGQLTDYLAHHCSRAVLTGLLSGRDNGDPLRDRLILDHAAALVFPPTAAALHRRLTDAGFRVVDTVPSVIVRQRLCKRYGIAPADCAVFILRACRETGDAAPPQRLELFYPAPAGTADPAWRRARADERAHNRETHFAFTVPEFDSNTYHAIRRHFAESSGLRPDGGGWNPHERSHGPGCSTFYFAGPGTVPGKPWPRRLEIICGGLHADELTAHGVSLPSANRG
ncbi:hypothetical protein [Nocardia sp. alder85J]|uniref:hypothetical protein n=1 Tax=Nocardia sp. alder85J TaxID=2862949 RepID=UPI001CD2E032|nr:hypothetical protein [Nocardia sp. alder85J]MCX4091473.1 hypothetical protein [Nocardia sp. alder85J]